jgi:hypothetical protein
VVGVNPYVHGAAVFLTLVAGLLVLSGGSTGLRVGIGLLVVALLIDGIEFARYRKRRRS